MKIITGCLFLTLVLASFSGCISNDTAGLSSRSLTGIATTTKPSLVDTEKGFHPYATAAFTGKHSVSNREYSIEEYRAGTATVGMNYHKSMEERNAVLPYFGLALSGGYTWYEPEFLDSERAALESAGITVDNYLDGYSGEMIIQPGMLFKLNRVLMQVYLQGIVTYEDGSYASLREKADGTANMFNLTDNPWTFGYGLGYEFQFGTPGSWDIGFFMEYHQFVNRTQSVSYDYIKDESATMLSPGGDVYIKHSFKFGPFMDFQNFRAALFLGNNIGTIQLTWRF